MISEPIQDSPCHRRPTADRTTPAASIPRHGHRSRLHRPRQGTIDGADRAEERLLTLPDHGRICRAPRRAPRSLHPGLPPRRDPEEWEPVGREDHGCRLVGPILPGPTAQLAPVHRPGGHRRRLHQILRATIREQALPPGRARNLPQGPKRRGPGTAPDGAEVRRPHHNPSRVRHLPGSPPRQVPRPGHAP